MSSQHGQGPASTSVQLHQDAPPPGMPGYGPQVEVFSGAQPNVPEEAPKPSWRRALLPAMLFTGLFLLVVVPASMWNYARAPLYRSSATLLTAVEPGKRPSVNRRDFDDQHVAIQRRLLLGHGLIEAIHAQLADDPLPAFESPESIAAMLKVEAVPHTNLVELSATGGDPDALARVVEIWISSFRDLRQNKIEEQIADQVAVLSERQDSLDEQIARKREAMDDFRDQHKIASLERNNNEALRRLGRLREQLNEAEAAEAAARAELAAIRVARERGQPSLSGEAKKRLAELRAQERRARSQADDLKKRYTAHYIRNDPTKQAVLERLQEIRRGIASLSAKGRRDAVIAISNAAFAAQQQTDKLRGQISRNEEQAKRFERAFATYETMQKDLTELEQLARDVRNELARIRAEATQKYPQIEVIEPPHVPTEPVAPAYQRDLWITLAAAALIAALITLITVITTRPRPVRESPQPMTGVRVYAGAPTLPTQAPQDPMLAAPAPGQTPNLPRQLAEPPPIGAETELVGPDTGGKEPPPTELLTAEISALWEIADSRSRQFIGLMLSGVDPAECQRVNAADFDPDCARVRVGDPQREIALSTPLKTLFATRQPLPLWRDEPWDLIEEMAHQLILLATDAGISRPELVTPSALRHSYIAYLVRQGARLTELTRLIGPVAAMELSTYRTLAPAGPAKPLTDIDVAYPLPRS